jgi:hypothetical protein
MSKETKRVRWDCPNGHPGVLGSTRPPKDSIVRYCLTCSAQTGRLVLRVAPALERQREAAAARGAVKAAAKRERAVLARERARQAENARYTVEGVDLRVELRRLIKLRAFGGREGRLFVSPPELVISRRHQHPSSRLGYAEPWRNRITLATYPGQTLADARETLVHELTHIVVGGHQDDGKWHGPTFKRTMLAAFKEAYKVGPVGIPDSVYHGRYAAALLRKERI